MKGLLQKQKERDKARSFKRENKNRPMEMSSKRPVPRLREVVQVSKKCAASSRLAHAALLDPAKLAKTHQYMHVSESRHTSTNMSQQVLIEEYCRSTLGCQVLRRTIIYCREGRDPRFDSLSGALQQDRFRKQYAFLYDEQLPAEKEELKFTLQAWLPLKSIAFADLFKACYNSTHGVALKTEMWGVPECRKLKAWTRRRSCRHS